MRGTVVEKPTVSMPWTTRGVVGALPLGLAWPARPVVSAADGWDGGGAIACVGATVDASVSGARAWAWAVDLRLGVGFRFAVVAVVAAVVSVVSVAACAGTGDRDGA